MQFKPYSKYKDSGVEWLGKVPKHWQVRALQIAARSNPYAFVDGPFGSDLKNEEYTESGVPLIQLNNIGVGYHSTNSLNFVSQEKSKQLRKHQALTGDVVIAKMAEPVARAAKVSDEFSCYVIVADCIKLTVDEERFNSNFIVYYLNSPTCKAMAEAQATGTTRLRINLGMLKKLPLLFPPLPEQHAIASYLDCETARLDDLISRQQRLIELLQEKRQALIGHAVTRGLDENVALKDSGVEWLGKVPEHWEVKKLGYMATLKSGDAITSEQIEEEGTYSVFGGNGLRGYTEKFTHSGYYVLIGRQGALCGNINYASGEFWASEHAVVVNPLCKFETVWMGELLRSMNLGQYSISAAQPGLSVEVINKLKIPIPPLPEQRAIANHIETETSKIDRLIARAERAITLMQEHRSALITAAVTGQIDVRCL